MQTFRKNERLCRKTSIDELFSKGQSFFVYPFKISWIIAQEDEGSPAQVLISVPKRNFKKAVKRNQIKRLIREVYRKERASYKLDLALNGNFIIELFSFSKPPERVSRPEANGLRHLAFSVENIALAIKNLNQQNIKTEPIRIDEFTGKRFTFFEDPDRLPLEIYEV